MAYIQFTDEVGPVTIVSSYPAGPARRFRNWLPDVVPIGPRTVALGTGRTYEFAFRRDYIANFEIVGIQPSQHADFHRFKNWAMKGCVFDVYTEDEADRFYECRIAPGTTPRIELEDATTLDYTASISARNIGNTPMICNYRG